MSYISPIAIESTSILFSSVFFSAWFFRRGYLHGYSGKVLFTLTTNFKSIHQHAIHALKLVRYVEPNPLVSADSIML